MIQNRLHDWDDATGKPMDSVALEPYPKGLQKDLAMLAKQADRFNSGKPEWSLVDFESLIPMVRVLEYGANKYSAHNWKKGFPYTKLMESMLRHCFAYLNGEDKDPESGLDHIGHIMCNAMFLSYNHIHHKEFDDRYHKPTMEKEDG